MTDETPAAGHNSYRVTAAELRSFVERVEALEAEKAETARDIREVYQEAGSRGYDKKALRRIVADRKKDADKLAEEEAVLEMYRAALGMAVRQLLD